MMIIMSAHKTTITCKLINTFPHTYLIVYSLTIDSLFSSHLLMLLSFLVQLSLPSFFLSFQSIDYFYRTELPSYSSNTN